MSRCFFLLIDELDVLNDDMFGDLSSEMNEVYILIHLVESFDTMEVFEIAIDSILGMVAFSGYSGWVFLLHDDFSDDYGLVRDRRTHIMQGAGMRKRTRMFSFITPSEQRGCGRLFQRDKTDVTRGKNASLLLGFTDHPCNGLLRNPGHANTSDELIDILLRNEGQNHRDVATARKVTPLVLLSKAFQTT